jgi:hypothetical protein
MIVGVSSQGFKKPIALERQKDNVIKLKTFEGLNIVCSLVFLVELQVNYN